VQMEKALNSNLQNSAKKWGLTGLFKLMFFLYGFLAIVFQGCFEGEHIFVFGALLAVLCLISFEFPIKRCLLPVFVLILFVFLNYLLGSGKYIETFSEAYRWFTLLFSGICFSTRFKKAFSLGIYFGITFSAFLGLLAYFRIIPSVLFETVQLADTVDGSFQLFSVFGYSNTAAVFFGCAIFMGIIFFEEKALPAKFALLIIPNLTALYFTHSAFALTCFLVGILAFYFSKSKKTKLFFILLAVAFIAGFAVIALFPDIAGSTVISRVIYAQDAISALNPLGIGFGQWSELKYSVQSAIYSTDFLHNGYLQLMLEGGIHILLTFLVFIVLLLRGIIRAQKPLVFGMTMFVLLHSFFDIDMTYGALYILLGFSVSYCPGEANQKKLFKPCFAGVCITTVFTAFYLLYFSPNYITPEILDKKIQNQTVSVSELSVLYDGARQIHDANSMDYFSALWLEKAPKSQEAFDARIESINKVYLATLDKNHYEVSRQILYERMDIANKSMNKLCKYLDKNRYIELP